MAQPLCLFLFAKTNIGFHCASLLSTKPHQAAELKLRRQSDTCHISPSTLLFRFTDVRHIGGVTRH